MLDRINGATSAGSIKSTNLKTTKMPAFKQILQQKVAKISVSKHAQQRLITRNLQLQPEDMSQLSTAMNELQAKGSKESLLVYKNMGIIANVQNRTIITAMDMNELGTVTNIDSTKFIK
jgi:flagellar operon protein